MNIALQLTAPGVAAIAIVRLRGPGVSAFLARYFSTAVRDGQAVHGHLRDGQREIDDPLICWDAATSTADICTHGGLWVVHEVLELVRRKGFVLVDTGTSPLPEEAWDAPNPLAREILQYLPQARTRQAMQTLLNQQEAWQKLLADDADPAAALANARHDKSLPYLLNPPRIAIIGIPNAGKSTLANGLFGQQRSIVADLPGTTRDWVADYANLDGLPVMLLDTPGIRDTRCILEAAAIHASMGEITTADLVVLLLDPTQPVEGQNVLRQRYPQALVVAGKCDLAGSSPWPGTRSISAQTGEGMKELAGAIRQYFDCQELPHARPCVWTSRQREILAGGDSARQMVKHLIG